MDVPKDMTEDMTCVGSMDLDVEEESEPVQVTRYGFYWRIFDIHTVVQCGIKTFLKRIFFFI